MRTSCTYHPTASSQTSQNCVYSTCNLDVHMTIQQQILRLQVSVDDVPVVTVLDCRQNLPKLPSGLQLTETPVLCQIVCNQSDRYCVSYMQISMLIILFQTQLKKQHWKGIFILLIVGAWKKKTLLMRCKFGANSGLQRLHCQVSFVNWFGGRFLLFFFRKSYSNPASGQLWVGRECYGAESTLLTQLWRRKGGIGRKRVLQSNILLWNILFTLAQAGLVSAGYDTVFSCGRLQHAHKHNQGKSTQWSKYELAFLSGE